MQVLIADRNARLLEAIARTFAQQFTIHTAATHQQCKELLLRGAFDLVVISEKLADGLGLQLLAQVARNTPDTLRVFAARRSRLQLLKGKLGPFGLFRTLAYPINPQELLSLLTLARAGLEIQAPAVATRDGSAVERQGGEVPSVPANATPPLQRPPVVAATASAPAPDLSVQPVVEQISLTSGDAAFAIDVPKMIASTKRRRRAKPASAAPPHAASPASAPTPAPTPAPEPNVAPQLWSAASQPQRSARDPQSNAPQRQATQAQSHAPQPKPVQAQHSTPPSVSSQATAVPFRAPPRLPPQRTARQHRSARYEDVPRSPMRARLVLGATIAAVFVATTLTLNLLDGGVHITRASTPGPEIARPSSYTAPPPDPAPALAPAFQPVPQVARRAEPKPAATKSDVDPTDPQMAAAGNTPIADPSSFGSEAYEPIYSN
jgi:CheY-like chemotaxis protein